MCYALLKDIQNKYLLGMLGSCYSCIIKIIPIYRKVYNTLLRKEELTSYLWSLINLRS